MRSRENDSGTYNLLSANEVAGLVGGDLDIGDLNRDIILEHQFDQLKRIDELHLSYLPLQYPLLFPYGEDGFREDISHSEASDLNIRK